MPIPAIDAMQALLAINKVLQFNGTLPAIGFWRFKKALSVLSLSINHDIFLVKEEILVAGAVYATDLKKGQNQYWKNPTVVCPSSILTD
eukprot:scaffold22560_cov135-Cylindrotheca_fusiformis.AAC.23